MNKQLAILFFILATVYAKFVVVESSNNVDCSGTITEVIAQKDGVCVDISLNTQAVGSSIYSCDGDSVILKDCTDSQCQNCQTQTVNSDTCFTGLGLRAKCVDEIPKPWDGKAVSSFQYSDSACKELVFASYVVTGCNSGTKTTCKSSTYTEDGCTDATCSNCTLRVEIPFSSCIAVGSAYGSIGCEIGDGASSTLLPQLIEIAFIVLLACL